MQNNQKGTQYTTLQDARDDRNLFIGSPISHYSLPTIREELTAEGQNIINRQHILILRCNWDHRHKLYQKLCQRQTARDKTLTVHCPKLSGVVEICLVMHLYSPDSFIDKLNS